MEMKIDFPGGKRVNAAYDGFTIATDQPVKEGGTGSAPEPFHLFLASLGTCAGVYVLYFCEERNIDTTGLKMSVTFEKDARTHLVTGADMHILLPPGFPPKYKKAVVKAAGLCTVKRNIAAGPNIAITADIQT